MEPAEDDNVLRRLEERLSRAADAAERVIGEAAESVKPPAAGWQEPASRDGSRPDDLELLLALFQSLSERVPPELRRRLAEAVREVLLALRALIDWYLDRIERRRAAPAEVEDIPIL